MSDLSTIKLRQKYQIETGRSSVHTLYNQDDEGYTDKYVKWLESIAKKANGVSASDSDLHLQHVSVAKHPLPRPLECWNKAREMECGDYIEWHLNKESGNAR